jgi:hypothetical protein
MSPPTVGHETSTRASGPGRAPYPTALAVTASAYALLHHLGSLPSGLGDAPQGTRWADWLDLLIPYLVLAPAAATLRFAAAGARLWALLGAGTVMYASGHGIHLAANSIGNVSPGPTAHLWDEVVGHHVWYAGVALITAAVAGTMTGRERPTHPGGYLLAMAVGVTWATNAIGGGTAVPGLLVAVAAVAFGWRHRNGLPVVLVVGYTPSVVLLAAELARNVL